MALSYVFCITHASTNIDGKKINKQEQFTSILAILTIFICNQQATGMYMVVSGHTKQLSHEQLMLV